MHLPATPRKRAGENVIPLINIVFLLLVFFLLAGTFEPRPPFEIEAIATRTGRPAQAAETPLAVAASGRIYYRGRATSLPELTQAVVDAHDDDAPLEILLDRRLRAQLLHPVIEALSRGGVTKIRLLTERSER